MPIFHLHIRSGGGLMKDLEGMDLPDLTAAKAAACQGIRDIVAEHVAAGEPLTIRGIEICDDKGQDLATMTVAEAISSTIPVSEDTFPVDLTKYLDSQYNPCKEDGSK